MDLDAVAVLPPDEQARLEAVRRYDILDTPPDGAFDRIAALAARFFAVPIATVTIVDHDRIWFKAAEGIEVDEIPREPGLCASAILQDDPYVVTDAIDDPRCLDNELVRGELGLRFYAAAQIRTCDGHNLGTVNVIDRQARTVTAADLATLTDLAAIVADELEVRLAARRMVESERIERERAQRLIDILQRRLLPHRLAHVPGLEIATYYRPATAELQIGGDFFDVFDIDSEHWAIAIGDVCGKGPEAAAATGDIRYALRSIARIHPHPRDVLARLNDVLWRDGVGTDPDAPGERFCTASLMCFERGGPSLTATVANAGHPLALLRRGDGTVVTVGEPGQLLGPFPNIELTQSAVDLEPGDLLLLYTDGAVEQHGVPTEIGERALVSAFRSAPGDSAQAALAHIRRAVERLHDTIDDDIALLVAAAVAA